MNARAREALEQLLEGNRRFREQRPANWTYSQEDLRNLAEEQVPIAAVITCSDARVPPEVLFDQPLGALFVSRVPGNVASDGTKWMIDLAVASFKVPLVVVMGHSGCLAVTQVVHGQTSGPGGALRLLVQPAVYRARNSNVDDIVVETVKENAKQTVEDLREDSLALRQALAADTTSAVAMYYDMPTGEAIVV